MTFGSLFAGIGGLDLGLERAGMECRWQVEINAYARQVLAKHWPEVTRHEDVHAVGTHNLEHVDLICGGFPCQNISLAGKGEGIEKGKQSGLWREFARIIRELRPSYVLVENVAALRSRGLDRVLGDLAQMRFDASWDCIPAAAVGAPHRRDRLFVVAHAIGDGVRRQPERNQQHAPERGDAFPLDDGAQESMADPSRSGREAGEREFQEGEPLAPRRGAVVANADIRRFEALWRGQLFDRERQAFRHYADGCRRTVWASESGVCRVADGVPRGVERLRCLGNAVVPQVAEWIGRRIRERADDRTED